MFQADLNLLYWSSEGQLKAFYLKSDYKPHLSEVTVAAEDVCGKCNVVCGEDMSIDRDQLFNQDSNTFYYLEVCKIVWK